MSTAIRNFNGPPAFLTVGSCPECGRACYISRRLANRAAKGMFPGAHHQAIPCGQYWHIQRVRGEGQ
ncbi:hypothetical protein ACIP4S_13330 [Streptomyces chartreusis]|uniref:hypothetical protein n=1 Tax=Streptomyces chartreusis TaxID=1969 RepID=UPI00380B6656